jgi:ribosomal protein L37AE/L43A
MMARSHDSSGNYTNAFIAAFRVEAAPQVQRQFEARKTNCNDCKVCHNARGIWRDRTDRTFWVCDMCFAEVIEQRKTA